MSNHYHLMLETPEPGEDGNGFGNTYTMRFNLPGLGRFRAGRRQIQPLLWRVGEHSEIAALIKRIVST